MENSEKRKTRESLLVRGLKEVFEELKQKAKTYATIGAIGGISLFYAIDPIENPDFYREYSPNSPVNPQMSPKNLGQIGYAAVTRLAYLSKWYSKGMFN